MMKKYLNFICPTDHLELTIEQTFKQENYFYTSLANSIVFDSETLGQINEIIEAKNINGIRFFLSRDNEIIHEALRNHKYNHLKGMSKFYELIENQIQHVSFDQPIEDIELLLISNYLNEKVNELRQTLNDSILENTVLKGLVYNRQNKAFIEAKSELFDLDRYYLN